jgi:hypothetical protein
MKRPLIAAVLVLVLSASAQGPQKGGPAGGPPPMVSPAERVSQALKLDAAKTESLKKVFDAAMKDRERFRIALERKQLDLREATLSGVYEMDKIRKICEEKAKLMADMQVQGFATDLEVKKLLSLDQWNQYLKMKKMLKMHKMRQHGMREGRGPQGMPPPPNR